jgi:exodeoxyribonuclease-3
MTKGFMDFFSSQDFDIFNIQETKMQREQAAFDFADRSEHWNSALKKGYSGTASFSKKEPLGVSYGFGIEEHDNEGRVINLEYDKFYIVNCYTPNSKAELLRLDYRMVWEDAFREHVNSLNKKKPVIICGDLNVAHKEIDLKNPKTNMQSAGFTDKERNKMTQLLESGFVDSFRHLYPDALNAYTWWSYIGRARQRNAGWRIDYFIVSESLKDVIKEALIYDKVFGSDHCPVGLIIDI